MRKGTYSAALVVAAVAALTVATTAPARSDASSTIKAAWIYVGPHNDGGWSQAHDRGRLYVQKELGTKVVTTYKENVPEGPQVVAGDRQPRPRRQQDHLRHLVRLHGRDGRGREEVPGRLVRARDRLQDREELRQLLRRRRGRDLPLRHRRRRRDEEGRRRLHRPVRDPRDHPPRERVRARRAAREARRRRSSSSGRSRGSIPPRRRRPPRASLAAGADVIGQNVDSPAAGQYAQSKGLPWVGYNSDSRKFAPTSWLAAAVYDWGPYYLKRVKAAVNGTWKTGSYWGTMKDGFTLLSRRTARRSRAKTKAADRGEAEGARQSGTFYEFQGPLYDQSGKLRVPKGKRMTLPQILAVDWLVRGIEGSAKG